jgi:hypothetical protein
MTDQPSLKLPDREVCRVCVYGSCDRSRRGRRTAPPRAVSNLAVGERGELGPGTDATDVDSDKPDGGFALPGTGPVPAIDATGRGPAFIASAAVEASSLRSSRHLRAPGH